MFVNRVIQIYLIRVATGVKYKPEILKNKNECYLTMFLL